MSRKLFVSLMFVTLTATVGACKKPPPPEPTVQAPPPEPPPAAEAEPVTASTGRLDRVTFQYDSTSMDSSTAKALSSNVEILQANPNTRVEVQGHADERGTTEYNLALGQRRAEAVKERMVRMGISGARLTTISYGEERPLDRASNDAAWASNRRAEFRVLSNGAGESVQGTVP